jgi:hypothetical protein
MKNQVAVSLEERIFNELSIKAQMQDNISPLLQNTLDSIKKILVSQNISAVDEDVSEEENRLLESVKDTHLKNKFGQDRINAETQIMESFYNQLQKKES